MKVSTALQHLQEMDQNDEIIINWITKSIFEDYYNDEEPLTNEKWLSFAKHLESADKFWQHSHYNIEAEVDYWQDLQEEKKEEEEE